MIDTEDSIKLESLEEETLDLLHKGGFTTIRREATRGLFTSSLVGKARAKPEMVRSRLMDLVVYTIRTRAAYLRLRRAEHKYSAEQAELTERKQALTALGVDEGDVVALTRAISGLTPDEALRGEEGNAQS